MTFGAARNREIGMPSGSFERLHYLPFARKNLCRTSARDRLSLYGRLADLPAMEAGVFSVSAPKLSLQTSALDCIVAAGEKVYGLPLLSRSERSAFRLIPWLHREKRSACHVDYDTEGLSQSPSTARTGRNN
jgi:hypothetical protein